MAMYSRIDVSVYVPTSDCALPERRPVCRVHLTIMSTLISPQSDAEGGGRRRGDKGVGEGSSIYQQQVVLTQPLYSH